MTLSRRKNFNRKFNYARLRSKSRRPLQIQRQEHGEEWLCYEKPLCRGTPREMWCICAAGNY